MPDDKAQTEELLQLRRMGLSYPDIAKRTGIPAERVRGKIKQALARGGNDPRRRLFDLDEFKFGTPFDLRGDFVIVGDVHVPATDWDLARLVSRVGGRCLAEPRLIIAGDMFNLDFASRFDPTVRYPHWSQERDAARAVLKEWRETFKDIYILMGNHDRRMIKWSAAELEVKKTLLLSITTIIISSVLLSKAPIFDNNP